MASATRRRPENVAGDLFVDDTCIDCDTCRWMAPSVFDRAGEQSRVHRQPAGEPERQRALMALIACPTASIGTVARAPLAAATAAFPDPIDGPVSHCGYHAEASFGATAYFVARPGGNVLVDSPRFAAPLVRRLEELGGVTTLFLTHQDDVADHAKWAAHFRATRVLHERDLQPDTRVVEHVVGGDEPLALDDELLLIPTPGHTRGSACLLFRNTYLFTGDHLAFSERLGHPYAFRSATWFDWRTQVESMRRLLGRRFEWILPGHGRRCRYPAEEMPAQMRRCVEWMEGR